MDTPRLVDCSGSIIYSCYGCCNGFPLQRSKHIRCSILQQTSRKPQEEILGDCPLRQKKVLIIDIGEYGILSKKAKDLYTSLQEEGLDVYRPANGLMGKEIIIEGAITQQAKELLVEYLI